MSLTAAAIAGAAWGLGSGATALWAARRMRRRMPRLDEAVTAQAVVIIPATGPLPGLEALMAALGRQTCRPRAVVFAVESELDPAFARLAGLPGAGAGAGLPVAVVIAGEAVAGGQKGRNLAAALRAHGGDAPFIVLADADIVPPPDWLAHLLRPLSRGAAEIVTGYRWPVPGDARPATVLGTWIDRGVAGLPKPNRGWLVWGGSVALTPAVAGRLSLADLLEREISDDLALATAARAAGLRILFRGAVLVPTPFGHSLSSLLAFGRRQYQMFILYQPWLWAWAGATVALNLFGSLSLAWLAVAGGPAGAAAFALSVLLAALGDRERRRLAAAAGIAGTGDRRAEAALRLVPLVLPLVHLLHLAAVVGSLRRGRVAWGHCVYRMRGRQVLSVTRRPWQARVSDE
ncbi:glycosyltransferase family 2 protein [Zavarzinia compransoris]|uniref:Glycosyl transferase n=1 Tax=Zavarzinia compransoris TaxID=1264899 RepID=A0A317DYI0_9PROT|nr:glycosyltransferase [Zavarzinia compransoris]PWR19729.1 hypothetical protein DKG75_14785 [Zavarzinia compransoris]TDP43323.1 cellulose synthase/poly-beta-1,6-N-acetylglucosamine synthase-like glycosyltransferase [Zavarzinia compransoris]